MYFFFFITVELQEPYLITKLDSAEKTWKELSVCMTDTTRYYASIFCDGLDGIDEIAGQAC